MMFNIESASLPMSHCLIDYSFTDMFYFYLSASWNKTFRENVEFASYQIREYEQK